MYALKLYRQWEERRRLKWFEWWERKRALGRTHYVRWNMLFWSGVMVNARVLVEVFNKGDFSFEKFLYMLPLYFAGGWLVGSYEWRSSEKRYQKYLAGGAERRLRQ